MTDRTTANATDGHNVGGERTPRESSAMLDVQAVADLLQCSSRHVYRLADMGKILRPLQLGALCRWSRASIDAWIAGGCKAVRSAQGAGR